MPVPQAGCWFSWCPRWSLDVWQAAGACASSIPKASRIVQRLTCAQRLSWEIALDVSAVSRGPGSTVHRGGFVCDRPVCACTWLSLLLLKWEQHLEHKQPEGET